jgi:phospholipid/cholesterol/gamma-HCH transport system permease protein
MDDVPITSAPTEMTALPSLRVQQEHGSLSVFFQGDWTWRAPQPALLALEQGLTKGVTEVRCHAEGLKQWDSSLLALLLRLRRRCEEARIPFRADSLPVRLKRLLDEVPRILSPKEPAPEPAGMFKSAGLKAMRFFEGAYRTLYFTGECAQALGKVCRFPKALRWPQCRVVMQECGPASLGIVGLVSFLTGCILAWQGALQLRQFGAEIYVADLVGVALVREMGPIMVAIVLAGRIGASFAAHLACMEGSEEVDALRTWGFSPVQFLVLPRLVALTCMMPLLVLYADLLGIAGGLAVSVGFLGVAQSAFLLETWQALSLADLRVGLLKSLVFGAGVAGIGCATGLMAKRSADGVGEATTSSVVKSIVFIIVVDAIFGACSHPSLKL